MNSTAPSHVAQVTAQYSGPAPTRFEVVQSVVGRFGSGARKDYEAAQRAFDRAVTAGEVHEVEGRVYVVAA